MEPFEHELGRGVQIAERAGALALRYWEAGVATETKPDDSPVTRADRESEALIVRALAEQFPEDGILGEEGAQKESRSGRRWIIDPIDGTRDFVRGNRFWAIMIGLEQEGETVAGFVHLPALNEMFYAARGRGAFLNGQQIRVSSISSPSLAVACIDGLNDIIRYPFSSGLCKWLERFWSFRAFGGIVDAMMVARGQAELWLEPKVAPWDLAAPKVILEEAGARFFNFDGGSSIYGGNCVACVPALESEVRRFLLESGE